MFVYSIVGAIFNFALMFLFGRLSYTSEIETIHSIILIVLTAIGGISGIVSAIHYKGK